MIVRENILLCNNREFIKVLYPHPSKTGLLETLYIIVQWQIHLLILEDDPVPIIDEEKNLSDDEVVEWLMMCWHVVL